VNSRRQSGFTLLELLLVVVVVAIASGLLLSTIPSGITPQQHMSQSRELASYLRFQREEAVMTSRTLGLQLYQQDVDKEGQRYIGRWLIYDENATDNNAFWLPSERISDFTIEPGYSLQLFLDEQLIPLSDEDSQQPEAIAPQLFFLSSGELNDFVLELCRAPSEPVCHRVKGNYLGQIKLLEEGDDDA
jgi:general secretion pathway protein H